MQPSEIRFEVFAGVSSPWAFFGAPEAQRLAQKYGITLHLRPIIIIESNGGIPLRTRPSPRQAYHALELARWSKRYGIPLNLQPRYYPLPAGRIQLSAQAIIRLQKRLGAGNEVVLAFSYAIQRALWVEERDISRIETLREIAGEVGVPVGLVEEVIEDRVGDGGDEAVREWEGNLKEAERLGIFGTPNYVINGEIFWGQDRLSFVDERLAELLGTQPEPTPVVMNTMSL